MTVAVTVAAVWFVAALAAVMILGPALRRMSAPDCVCAEINARHCPAHGGDES